MSFSAAEGSSDSFVLAALQGLCSAGNAERDQAESQFNQALSSHPREIVLSLCRIASSEGDLAPLAAVVLRRVLLKPFVPVQTVRGTSLWGCLDTATRETLKSTLLSTFTATQKAPLANKLADLLAEIARICSGEWAALFDCILTGASLSAPTFRICSIMRIIHTYPPILRTLGVAASKEFFARFFSEAVAHEASLQALKAFAAHAASYGASSSKASSTANALAPLMNAAVEFIARLQATSPAPEESLLQEALSTLTEMTAEIPKVFKPVLGALLPRLTQMASNSTLEDSSRQAALELFVSLCEALPSAVIKGHLPSATQMIQAIFQHLLPDIQDDADWYECSTLDHTTGASNSNSETENYAVGEQALDRLSLALGSEAVLPVAFEAIPKFLASPAWPQRRAALMAIAYLAEGCAEELEGHLDQVLTFILTAFADPHPRVRYAAIQALGQLCTDFAVTIQSKYHLPCVQALLRAMSFDPAQGNHVRVQSHAAAAIINFCDGADHATLVPYLDSIMESLLGLLSSPKIYAQEQAISTISVIADVLTLEQEAGQQPFIKYYYAVITPLMQILMHATAPDYRMLRAKAIDAVTLVALAVGKQVFQEQQIANQVVGVMAQIQKSEVPSDDPINIYLPEAWVRICRVFEAEFHPLMALVFPKVLQTALLEPDMALLEADEQLSEEHQSEDWEFALVQGKRVGIKTSTLEEKANAVQNLQAYAEILGKAFEPYAAQTLEVILPLYTFDYHDGVRIASVSATWHIMQSIEHPTPALIDQVISALIEALVSSEDEACEAEESDFVCECLDVLGKVLQAYKPALDKYNSLLGPWMGQILQTILDHVKRAEWEAAQDDAEALDLDEVLLGEENVVIELGRLIHAVLVAYGRVGLGLGLITDQVIQACIGCLSQSQRASLRQMALGVFGDLIEYGQRTDLLPHFGDALLQMLGEGFCSDVRRAACYTVGQCAQFGGEGALALVRAAFPRLIELSSNYAQLMVRVNAISAVAKSLTAFSSALIASDKEWMEIGKAFAAWMPALDDEEEVEVIYGFLVQVAGKCGIRVERAVIEGALPLVKGEGLRGEMQRLIAQ